MVMIIGVMLSLFSLLVFGNLLVYKRIDQYSDYLYRMYNGRASDLRMILIQRPTTWNLSPVRLFKISNLFFRCEVTTEAKPEEPSPKVRIDIML